MRASPVTEACFTRTVQTRGHADSCSESGACAMERCSPPAAPFPPRPPQEVSSLVRSVHRYYGTVRLLQHVHVRRSVYGLRGPAFTYSRRRVWRSPGSRACCFLACAGSQTTQDRTATRDNAAAVLPSSYSEGVGILIYRLFEAQSLRPPMPPAYASKLTSRWVPQD